MSDKREKDFVRMDRELIWHFVHQKDRYHILCLLLVELLADQGVDATNLLVMSKDEIANLLINHKRKSAAYVALSPGSFKTHVADREGSQKV